MKPVLIFLCVLTQWGALGEDCGLTFDNKEPSHIVEQMEKIYSMNIEQGLLCFSMLKAFLNPPPVRTPEADDLKNSRLLPYEHDRREDMERIEYLVSLLSKNLDNIADINPRVHPALYEEGLFLVKAAFAHVRQTRSLSGRPLKTDDKEHSQMEKQIKKFQTQPQRSIFVNPYLGFLAPIEESSLEQPPPASNEGIENSPPVDITAVNLYSTPEETDQKEYFWTETFHIEFPSIVVCVQPVDTAAKTFSSVLKIYENAVTDFADNSAHTDLLYTNIMKWLHLEKNQEGLNLQNSHPTFDLASYNMDISSIPEFVLNSMTLEQKDSLTHMMHLVRKYIWMKNLYFEYRKCLPQIFREHIWLSYTASAPLNEENAEAPPSVDVSYELASYTPHFSSSFKQNTPLRSLQESNIQWNNFHSNSARSKYESEWAVIFNFYKTLFHKKGNT